MNLSRWNRHWLTYARKGMAAVAFTVTLFLTAFWLAPLAAFAQIKGDHPKWKEKYSVVHPGIVAAVAIAPDDKTFATVNDAGREFSVRLWELETGKPLFTLKDTGGGALKFTPDGAALVIGAYQRVIFWDVMARKEMRSLPGFAGTICGLDISRDGKRLAVCDEETFVVYDLTTGKGLLRYSDRGRSFHSVAFSPDGSSVVLGTGDSRTSTAPGDLLVWTLPDGTLKRRLVGPGGEITSVAFSPDGSFIATGGLSREPEGPPKGQILLWSVGMGQVKKTLSRHESEVRSVAYSASGEFLGAAADDGTVTIWNPTTAELLNRVDPGLKRILCLAFSKHARYVVVGGEKGTISVLVKK